MDKNLQTTSLYGNKNLVSNLDDRVTRNCSLLISKSNKDSGKLMEEYSNKHVCWEKVTHILKRVGTGDTLNKILNHNIIIELYQFFYCLI